MVRLGLGIICKDEVSEIERILKDYSSYFGEIQITITHPDKRKELEEVCKKYNAVPSYFDWMFDFSKARNFNKAQFKKSEYYLRLDSDDAIVNPAKLIPLAEKAKEDGVSVVYTPYLYSKDEFGNCNASHYR